MGTLCRNQEFSLRHVDPDTGLGLAYSRAQRRCLLLEPRAAALFDLAPDLLDTATARECLAATTGGPISEKEAGDLVTSLRDSGLLYDPDVPMLLASPSPVTDDPPPLRAIYFYSTMLCNAQCYHCYQPIAHGEQAIAESRAAELTAAEVISLVESARPLGLASVKITGGEPFLRRDMVDIIRGINGLGIHVSIETNGTLVSDEAASVLADPRVTVAVSLDGASAATHDTYRGLPGAFDKAVDTLRRIAAAGGRPKVIASISRRNFNQIDDIIEVAKSHGCQYVKINPVSTLGVGQALKATGYLLSLDELLGIFSGRKALEDRHGVVIFLEGPTAFSSLAELATGRVGICPFTHILGLLSDGGLSFCGIANSRHELVLANIRDQGFRLETFWRTAPGLTRLRAQLQKPFDGVCGRCVFERFCKGSCRALAYDEYGSFLAPHVWCQRAYDEGRFPVQYLAPGESDSRSPQSTRGA